MTLTFELDLDILPHAEIQVCTSFCPAVRTRQTHTDDAKNITPITDSRTAILDDGKPNNVWRIFWFSRFDNVDYVVIS